MTPTLTQIAKPLAPSLRRYAQDPFNASAATAMERLQAVRSQRDVAPPSMSGPVYTAYCAATVMSERVHAAAIVEAVEAAEQVEATPAALMALLRDLRAIGVGHGDWSSLVQNIGGYGPSLQEAIVRLGACISRTLAALATQSCRAVESLPSAPGSQHTRDSPEVSMLREVIELLRRLESDGRLRGLVADGLIDRVRPRPTRSLRHSCARTARLERTHQHVPPTLTRTEKPLSPSHRTIARRHTPVRVASSRVTHILVCSVSRTLATPRTPPPWRACAAGARVGAVRAAVARVAARVAARVGVEVVLVVRGCVETVVATVVDTVVLAEAEKEGWSSVVLARAGGRGR